MIAKSEIVELIELFEIETESLDRSADPLRGIVGVAFDEHAETPLPANDEGIILLTEFSSAEDEPTLDLGKPQLARDENGVLTLTPNWAYRVLLGIGG